MAQEATPGEQRGDARVAAFGVVARDPLDLVLRAEYERRSRMQGGRSQVEDAIKAVDRRAAGLFDEEGDRARLIEEPQAPGSYPGRESSG